MISNITDTFATSVANKDAGLETFQVSDLHLSPVLATCRHKMKIQEI